MNNLVLLSVGRQTATFNLKYGLVDLNLSLQKFEDLLRVPKIAVDKMVPETDRKEDETNKFIPKVDIEAMLNKSKIFKKFQMQNNEQADSALKIAEKKQENLNNKFEKREVFCKIDAAKVVLGHGIGEGFF